MPIHFRCVYCNKLLGIGKRKSGAIVNCPQCGEQLIVPNLPDLAPESNKSEKLERVGIRQEYRNQRQFKNEKEIDQPRSHLREEKINTENGLSEEMTEGHQMIKQFGKPSSLEKSSSKAQQGAPKNPANILFESDNLDELLNIADQGLKKDFDFETFDDPSSEDQFSNKSKGRKKNNENQNQSTERNSSSEIYLLSSNRVTWLIILAVIALMGAFVIGFICGRFIRFS